MYLSYSRSKIAGGWSVGQVTVGLELEPRNTKGRQLDVSPPAPLIVKDLAVSSLEPHRRASRVCRSGPCESQSRRPCISPLGLDRVESRVSSGRISGLYT